MQLSHALNRRRIARSLVSVLGLSLIQTIVAPIIAPTVIAPKAEAVTATITPTSNAAGTNITIPAGVSSVTIEAIGGSGGKGGNDGNVGTSGTVAGRVITTIAVSPGDVLGLYGGRSGTPGNDGAQGNGGGAGAADTLPDGPFSINGTYYSVPIFAGGTGGTAGSSGSSGGGGGAGAASIATINNEIVVVAGGAGGGGGAGNGTSVAYNWGGTIINNGSNFSGSNGTGLAAANSCPGATNNNGDGGGGGGGGGGYFAGAGGTAPLRTTECSGTAGSPGGNYVVARGTSTTDDRQAQTTEGYVKYTYNIDVVTTCIKSVSTFDIYTIESITTTAQCTWSVPSTVSVLDLFLVGGGGGGGGDGGGGGGGGASLSRTAIAVTASSTLTLKTGYGGVGGAWGNPINTGGAAGDSTTVTLATGTTFSALGGSGATTALGAAGGVGGTAANAGFAGGAGGIAATATPGNIGGAGKTGISNYYTGNKIEYGGGGGGGTHVNGAATTAAAGASGGGAGGYAASSALNIPGANGAIGLGGGGGGGIAMNAGTGVRVNGGKGGSGVILIRYATNAADSFPASLTSAVAGRWLPSDLQTLDSGRKFWVDSTGTYGNVAVTGSPTITTQASTDGGFTTGSSKTNLIVSGGTGDKVTLVAGTLSTYTMLHAERYPRNGTSFARVVTASSGNFISGLYNTANDGVAHHNNNWLTPTNYPTAYKWLLSTDQAKLYRANGKDISYNVDTTNADGASGPTGLGINNYTNEPSSWQMTEVILFNRQLSAGEMRLMENYMARIYGLTLDSEAASSETDTAVNFNGGSYYYTQYNQYYLSDIFTIEFWLKPTSTCDSSGVDCAIYSLENSLVTRITGGTFWYALYGTTTGGWQYIDTGVKVKSGEWHHIALTKRGAANTNGGLDVYLDGQLAYTKAGDPYFASTSATTFNAGYTVLQSNTWTYIGARAVAGSPRFYGNIDEVKLWTVARTGAQIQTDMNSSDPSSANLQLYYDFNKNSLSATGNVPNLGMGGPARTDLIPAASPTYDDVKVTSTNGPYTTIRFPRTYITQTGGWKVPDSVTSATTIVVGGGGGSGKSDSRNEYPSGAGGGGGVTYVPVQTFTPSSIVPVSVGVGGLGATAKADDASNRNGKSSYLGAGAGLTALGGGGGGSNSYPGAGGSTVATGGGGGGSRTSGSCAALGASGGTVPSGYNGAEGGWGWGGLGGSARGASTTSSCYGIPGDGFIDPITNIEYGHTGSNQFYTTWSTDSNYSTANNGWGGSVSYGSGAIASGAGITGSAGVVIVRYITAQKPTYTKPTTAYLNVGMTETFTTNIAVDSTTVGLTRTFRWESTTAGSGGAFTTIKQGTGANNAFFSWVPSDTSTSGNQFLYRLVVTDSDTAGLFITDSSTAFAVINKTLVMSGVNTIKKQINVARNETFTITDGTPGYRYMLSPVIPGITLDTSTAGSAVLRISDTASVGTYLETLTVIDSVSASVAIPLSITISAPPTLVNTSSINESDLIFNIDMANSASYSRATGAISDISGTKKAVTINGGATFSDDFSGNLALSSTQHISAIGFGTLTSFTIEAYINLQSLSSGQPCIFSSEQTATNIAYFVCLDTSRTIFTGFYNGAWTYKRTSQTLTLGQWAHVVGTFDPTAPSARNELYINGVIATYSDGAENATLIPPIPTTNKIFINKSYTSATAPTSSMNIGFIRLYRSALNQAKVTQNYNATKDRFATVNQNQLKPSQKYGTLNLESFTVTSGGDTKTVTFAVGNRTGILWDTATAGVVKLSVQETLTPGTYYDTITVTDNFAQSTSLPIRFTVSKADTITVTAGAATTQVYNKAQASSLPAFGITGLVASDTGTVLRKYTGVDWTKTCAQGGGCEVGDTGPGGGTIFYISPTSINVATGVSTGGKYLEVAPLNWSGLGVESTTAWAKAQTSVAGTLSAIGAGAENTRLINNALTTNSVAAKVAADLVLNGKSDWFLPSTLEVKEIYDALYFPALGGSFSVRNYWSSTQGSNTGQADTYWFGNGGLVSPTDKLNSFTVRPIRAYSPDTVTSTTVPTNVDSYTVTVDTITMTTGSLSNYENVVYRSSGVDITKARQDSLTVTSYVGNFGTPFTVTILGGSGTGAMTESFTVGSTASGCAISNHVVTSSTAGTCNVQIKKAYSRNYFTETVTAVIYLMQWATNQPTTSGSGPTIGISGETAIIRDPNAAPTISSITISPGYVTITGSGFGTALNTTTVVKFWRNKLAPLRGDQIDNYVANDTTIYIYLIPVGASAGRIAVITPNGTAVSVDSWNP